MANITHSKHFTNYVVILIGYCLAAGTIIYNSLNGNLYLDNTFNIGLGLAQLAGIYLFYKSGTFFKTRYSRFARAGIALIIISILLKVLHYLGSEIALISGIAVIVICYVLAFYAKPIKKLLDWLKLVFVIISAFSYVSSFLHLGWYTISTFPVAVMLLMVILHINKEKKLGFPEDRGDDFSL